MKKRLVSFILVLCISATILTAPAFATTIDHTYYSQYGNINSSVDKYLCYLTCLAMAISDLGSSTTPSDIYRANGSTANTSWSTIQKAYGIIVKETPLKSFDIETGKNKVISCLNSGEYPQGIMLVFKYQYWDKDAGQYKDAFHAVLARKVVDGVIYCDDPAKKVGGCCIPLDQCYGYSSSGTYAGIYSYRTITKSSSWPGNGSSSSGEATVSPVSVISLVSGKWTVTIPVNYKLVCYTSANATKSSPNYISAKTEPYRLTCTQQATLSNGKTRYFFTSGDGKDLWFDYTNGMSAVSSDNTPTTSYTVNFNANGGSVGQSSKTVTNGQKYGDLPMPSMNGYSFDGWFTSANGGTLVTAATTVNLTGNQTLYAHWSENKETYTVYFDPDGGSVDINSKEVNYGEYYGELPTPYREGYKFEGWRTGRNGTGSLRVPGKKVTTKSDETLYAHWSPIDTRIRVHFDTNGGPDHGYLYYYEANDTYGNLPSTEWVGYTFDGWYTLANGGTKISSSTKLIQNSEHTLYAHWTKEEEIEPSTLTISGLKVTVSDGKIRASATVTSNYDLMDYSYSNGAAGGGLGSVGKNRKTFEYTYEVDYTNLPYDGDGTYTFWLTCTDMSGNSVTATYDYYLPGKNTPQYFNCNVGIFTIKGKTVNLYNNPGDSKRVDYFSLGQSVGSSYGVNMPDGTTWYQVSVTSKGNVITVWLKYESDKMTIRNL